MIIVLSIFFGIFYLILIPFSFLNQATNKLLLTKRQELNKKENYISYGKLPSYSFILASEIKRIAENPLFTLLLQLGVSQNIAYFEVKGMNKWEQWLTIYYYWFKILIDYALSIILIEIKFSLILLFILYLDIYIFNECNFSYLITSILTILGFFGLIFIRIDLCNNVRSKDSFLNNFNKIILSFKRHSKSILAILFLMFIISCLIRGFFFSHLNISGNDILISIFVIFNSWPLVLVLFYFTVQNYVSLKKFGVLDFRLEPLINSITNTITFKNTIFFILFITLGAICKGFFYTQVFSENILKMDTFGQGGGSSSSGPQKGGGSSGSGKNPNNNDLCNKFINNNNDNDKKPNYTLNSIVTQPPVPEDTLIGTKITQVTQSTKRAAINVIYNNIKSGYGNMSTAQKNQYIQDYTKALDRWNTNYESMTVKDFAVLKKGFVEYNWLLSGDDKNYLKNMAVDTPLTNVRGYEGVFFRSRDDSENVRKEALNILIFLRCDLK